MSDDWDILDVEYRRDMAKKEQIRRLREEIQCFLREEPRLHIFTKEYLNKSAEYLRDEMQGLDRRWA